MLVQDGSAPMRGVRWRTCPALFKTGMCEMKILGSEVSWCIFVMLVQDGLAPIFNIICFTIFTHGAKRDQTVSHSFC